MCKEHQVALSVINSYLDSGKRFTYDQIIREILDQGGMLRVSIGVTIRMYLKNLSEIGLLDFDPNTGQFEVNQNALSDHSVIA